MKRQVIIWFAVLLSVCSCLNISEAGFERASDNNPSFSIEEAKEIFERQYLSSVTKTEAGKSDFSKFAPGDFTPRWEQGKYSASCNKSGYDVPILADRRIVSVKVKYWGNMPKAYKENVHQRLVVMRDNENRIDICYILTLIPDRQLDVLTGGYDDFITFGSKKGRFSGLAVYTMVGTNELVRVSRYVDGVKTDGVFLADGNGGNGHLEKLQKAAAMLNGIKLISKTSIKTKFGEDWGDSNYVDDNGDGGYGDNGFEEVDGYDDLFIDKDGNYYIDLDGDGYPDTPCIEPSLATGDDGGDITDPEYGKDDGFDEPDEKDPNAETSDLEDCGGGQDDGQDDGQEPSSWKDEHFEEKNVMNDEAFVKYSQTNNCLESCKRIMDNLGYTNEYGNSGEVIYLVRENDEHTALENYGDNVDDNYRNAVECINEHLNDDRPIIAGVDHSLGGVINDGTIDHFVLIVGSGYDEELDRNYYIYVETGTDSENKGMNYENNRLYYDPEEGMFIDEEDRKGRELTLVEIRPNNGENYETVPQPRRRMCLYYENYLKDFIL